jgi:hypothetical protein
MAVTILAIKPWAGALGLAEQVDCANSVAENDLPASTLEFVLKRER